MFFIPISLLYYLFFSLSTLKIPAKYAMGRLKQEDGPGKVCYNKRVCIYI